VIAVQSRRYWANRKELGEYERRKREFYGLGVATEGPFTASVGKVRQHAQHYQQRTKPSQPYWSPKPAVPCAPWRAHWQAGRNRVAEISDSLCEALCEAIEQTRNQAKHDQHTTRQYSNDHLIRLHRQLSQSYPDERISGVRRLQREFARDRRHAGRLRSRFLFPDQVGAAVRFAQRRLRSDGGLKPAAG
jgi:hypothetical protein